MNNPIDIILFSSNQELTTTDALTPLVKELNVSGEPIQDVEGLDSTNDLHRNASGRWSSRPQSKRLEVTHGSSFRSVLSRTERCRGRGRPSLSAAAVDSRRARLSTPATAVTTDFEQANTSATPSLGEDARSNASSASVILRSVKVVTREFQFASWVFVTKALIGLMCR